jgi:hypothetical protein
MAHGERLWAYVRTAGRVGMNAPRALEVGAAAGGLARIGGGSCQSAQDPGTSR